ncbi:DUF1080 domain-containing protein [Robiginitalea sp. SC105]|uniref:3-keto-disaccharide hydrolase n=1 Tax=Robiginitalea sp. SC105 TaxID=2762332 RepID=UPI00163A36E1|nr:DUF1080 domain-containing protein [Robiginitalea sp. SC105]MBC2838402.1 DUF1080 domain-containing protein [Robiginitalea sp. SC105]
MKKITMLACACLVILGCKEKKETETEAAAEAMETAEMGETAEAEWIVLFDGTSFDGWKGYNQQGVPDAWTIEDGAMVLTPPEQRPEGANYNLVTESAYKNFVLSLEWQISEGGNSGVFWGVEELDRFGQPYETGPEIQVLDNEKHPDAKAGTTHQAGALYDMIAPARDVTNPVGEWNTMEITVDYEGQSGKVVLNGTELLTFPLGNEAWDAMVADSKFDGWEGFGKFPEGKIGLQDHGDKVAFRNIKLKPL